MPFSKGIPRSLSESKVKSIHLPKNNFLQAKEMGGWAEDIRHIGDAGDACRFLKKAA